MASRYQNITVDIGADYNANVVAYANGSSTTALNLTLYTVGANSHVKKSYYHGNTAAIFNVWVQDASSGIVNLHLNKANTLTLTPGKYVYDVMIENAVTEYKLRVVEGILTATAGVSK
jgi:hypothetical protein